MFLGHGLLAFALVAGVAQLAGWSRERAMAAGVLAAGFGLAPDVDILYAPLGVLGADGVFDAASRFWATGNEVHRAVTHSLVVGAVASVAAGAWATWTWPGRATGVALVIGLVTVALAVSGPVGGAVMTVFGAVVLGLAAAGSRRLSERVVTVAAAVGLFSHPFGDVLTGEPPAFLYPFDVTLLTVRPRVFADPTLNLMVPLFLELGTIWLALVVYCHFGDRSLPDRVSRIAGVGVAYAGAAVLVPVPTLEVSYHFVFPLVAIGLVAAVPAFRTWHGDEPPMRGERLLAAAVNGATAVTLAAVAYLVAYLVSGSL